MGLKLGKKISNHAYIERLKELPTLPAVAFELNRLVQNPLASTSKITEILKQDPVLTSKVLKLANSPYYCIPSGVDSLERALQFLGFNTLSQIILAVSVFSMFRISKVQSISLLDFWRHSFSVALICEQSLKIIQPEKSSLGFTVGLLHNIGKLAFSELIPTEYSQLLSQSELQKTEDFKIEEEELGTNHTELGAALSNYWGFPSTIGNCIKGHHTQNSTDLLTRTLYYGIIKSSYLKIVGSDPIFTRQTEKEINQNLFNVTSIEENAKISRKILDDLDRAGGIFQ